MQYIDFGYWRSAEKKRRLWEPARNTGFHCVWQMTNAELPRRGRTGTVLEAEPTKSLTTLLGLGQESLVNGSGGTFFSISDICFLLSTLWLLYALYHCLRCVLSRISRILIISPACVSFSRRLNACRDLCEFSLAAQARSLIDRVIYFRARVSHGFVLRKCKTFLLTRFTAAAGKFHLPRNIDQ